MRAMGKGNGIKLATGETIGAWSLSQHDGQTEDATPSNEQPGKRKLPSASPSDGSTRDVQADSFADRMMENLMLKRLKLERMKASKEPSATKSYSRSAVVVPRKAAAAAAEDCLAHPRDHGAHRDLDDRDRRRGDRDHAPTATHRERERDRASHASAGDSHEDDAQRRKRHKHRHKDHHRSREDKHRADELHDARERRRYEGSSPEAKQEKHTRSPDVLPPQPPIAGAQPSTAGAPRMVVKDKNGEISASVAETNRVRAALGLKPLKQGTEAPAVPAPNRASSPPEVQLAACGPSLHPEVPKAGTLTSHGPDIVMAVSLSRYTKFNPTW